MRHRCIPRDSARTSTAHNSETKQPEFDLHRKKKRKEKRKRLSFVALAAALATRFGSVAFDFRGRSSASTWPSVPARWPWRWPVWSACKCVEFRERLSMETLAKKKTTTTTTTASEDLRVFRIGHSDDEDGVVLQVKAPEALVGAAGVQVPYFKTLRCHTKSTQFNAINHAAHEHQTRSASLWPVAATWSYPWRVPYESTRRTFAPVAEIVGAESIKSYSPIGINGIDDIRREKKIPKKTNKQTKNNRWHRTDRSALREGPLLIS